MSHRFSCVRPIIVGFLSLLVAQSVAGQTDATLRPGFPVTLTNAGLVRFSTPLAVDLDNDGKKWIVVGTAGTGTGGWLYVISRFGVVRAGWPKQLPAEIASSPAAADIDGDGFPDIVVGYGSSTDLSRPGGVLAFRRNGTQIWQFLTQDLDLNGQPDHVWSTPALADLDGDGIADVVFGSWDAYIYALKGTTGQPLPGWPILARDTVWSSPAIADMDGDGHPDVVIGADSHYEGPPQNWKDGGALFALRANGTYLPGFPRWITPPFGQAPVGIGSSPAIGDIDGDGCPEIIVGTGNSTSPAEKFLYAFKSDGTSPPGWPVALNDHASASPALADLNGDSVLDVVVSDDSGYLYAIKGDGSFLFPPFRPKGSLGNISNTPLGLVVAQAGADNPAIFFGIGWEVGIVSKMGAAISDDGTHGSKLRYPTGNAVAAPIVADLDGTGQLTVIAASQPVLGAGGPNGAVFAWNIGSTSQNATPWPMLHRDAARRGSAVVSTPPACKRAPPATKFYPVSPCRISDSRNSGNLTYGGPALAFNEERTITIAANPSNPCSGTGGIPGVPATAKAVALNVTVTMPSTAGLLRLFPAGDGTPSGSAINYRAGQTRANNEIIPLSYDGTGNITVRVEQPGGAVHVILDVSGYFQ
jgi:hypothetical protein